YAMPRATDISAVDVKSNPVPTKTNPLGVKGAGEAGCVGAMPAVANALVDALSHLGVRHVEMPATPERLWRAMRDGHAKGWWRESSAKLRSFPRKRESRSGWVPAFAGTSGNGSARHALDCLSKGGTHR